jgi:hypothetical protein
MRLLRIDQTLELCENHLTSTKAEGTEIEALLTRSLLVLICAEFRANHRIHNSGKMFFH